MITMILCWVLYTKEIIGLALPIISTVLFFLECVLCCIRAGIKAREVIDE